MDAPIRLPDGTSGLTARPMDPEDTSALLELIDADELPGRHLARETLASTATGLHRAGILVVCDQHGRVVGAVRCGLRAADGAGLIVWLHGHEEFETVAALIALAQAHLGSRPLYACTGPATATGIPGLPVQHRKTTARALTAAGFTPTHAQQYFQHDLTTPPVAPEYPLADVTPVADPPGWQLELTGTNGRHIATAILRAPAPNTAGMAVLWQLVVRTEHRRRGIGTHLLDQCLHHAHAHGADRLAADVPEGDIPAAQLLAKAGFRPVDTLTVYHRRP
ncbi:GNAT family N-acetyltransferase [Streptomyces sp. NBC_01092]|uniref:GNAT family N-acetyltransferase n=1 Tax=Streptomyces sp. NBC_01092 TaxID=2903748 RepID=UPI00386F7BC1|nr:GNAT family N-acetyltransferase [Streptomyces sp. NBC_01092]